MSERDYLGEFELAVMLAVARRDGDAYGMTIRREIEEQGGREVSISAVYTTLRRLERKGYVSSRLGEPTSERGGRAKKFFRLEPAGAEALERTLGMLSGLQEGLPDPLPTRAD